MCRDSGISPPPTPPRSAVFGHPPDNAALSVQPLRSVRRLMLIEVVILRGLGVEADPYREVTMFFDDDGRCVAEHDPIFPTPWYAPTEACQQARQP